MNKSINKVWLALATGIMAIAPTMVQAQEFDLSSLPTKNYQSYPTEIPDKKWTSLFYYASRLYGRDGRTQALKYEHKAFSEKIDLASDGRIYGWYKEELDDGDKHFLINMDIQTCLNDGTFHSVVFTEMWDGRSLMSRRNGAGECIDDLAVQQICKAAIAEHKKRI